MLIDQTPDEPAQGRRPRARLSRGEEGGPLSRQLAHIGLQQLARLIRLGSGLLYSRVSGLSEFEWRVLARACDMPGLSINELGKVMRRGVAQVSRTVKRLVSLGLLTRENVGGGPGVAIRPTALGQEVYAPLVDLAILSERDLTRGLSEEDLKTLDRIMAVMTENALARIAREQQLAGDEALGAAAE
jgi:DNA-binding MarR family transcriptional regulator